MEDSSLAYVKTSPDYLRLSYKVGKYQAMNNSTFKMSPAFRISALLGIDITHLRVIACLKLLYKVRNY